MRTIQAAGRLIRLAQKRLAPVAASERDEPMLAPTVPTASWLLPSGGSAYLRTTRWPTSVTIRETCLVGSGAKIRAVGWAP